MIILANAKKTPMHSTKVKPINEVSNDRETKIEEKDNKQN